MVHVEINQKLAYFVSFRAQSHKLLHFFFFCANIGKEVIALQGGISKRALQKCSGYDFLQTEDSGICRHALPGV